MGASSEAAVAGVDYVVLDSAALPAKEFVGGDHLDATVSVTFVDNGPREGPRLHRHAYEEIFVVLDGEATFTIAGSTVAVSSGHIVVVPPGRPHRFVNSGRGRLRQLDIHPRGRFQTEWLTQA